MKHNLTFIVCFYVIFVYLPVEECRLWAITFCWCRIPCPKSARSVVKNNSRFSAFHTCVLGTLSLNVSTVSTLTQYTHSLLAVIVIDSTRWERSALCECGNEWVIFHGNMRTLAGSVGTVGKPPIVEVISRVSLGHIRMSFASHRLC